jgi:hypothetical protein
MSQFKAAWAARPRAVGAATAAFAARDPAQVRRRGLGAG